MQDLYYSAIAVRQGVIDGRDWLLDCFGGDPEAATAIRLSNAIGIVALVERHYEGGYRQLLIDSSNLREGA